MKKLVFIAMVAGLASASFAACVETTTGVKLEKGGGTVWAFEVENPECKPFLHPLALPDGRVVTDIRPKDHIWHLGAWFCWKYLNGVNYWEPVHNKGVEPEGRTMLREKKIAVNGDAAEVTLKLAYAPRKTPDALVLAEERKVTFTAPDAQGGYTVTFAHHFTAQTEVTLERTPPYLHGKGENASWGGGYAGFGLRLGELAKAFKATSSSGEASQKGIIDKEKSWIDFSDSANGHGVRLTVVKGTAETRFYHWADHRFLCPSVVYAAPIHLKPGETLDLEYKLTVH